MLLRAFFIIKKLFCINCTATLFNQGGTAMAIKIYIDQGHNPQNPNAGAEGNGYREQDLVYYIGAELAAMLNASPDFEAITSRSSPTEILGTSTSTSLSARVNDANSWGADYFISIHANASDIVSASGSEAYVYSFSSPAFALAQDILVGLFEATGLSDRGVFERPTLYVLRRTRMPSLLLEVGFITNANDAELMAKDPTLIARGIFNGILQYFNFSV